MAGSILNYNLILMLIRTWDNWDYFPNCADKETDLRKEKVNFPSSTI
jgi:hypothetical protein